MNGKVPPEALQAFFSRLQQYRGVSSNAVSPGTRKCSMQMQVTRHLYVSDAYRVVESSTWLANAVEDDLQASDP